MLFAHSCAPHDEASASSLTLTMILSWAPLPLKGRSETPSGACVWLNPEQASLGVSRGRAHSDVGDGLVGALLFSKHSGSPGRWRLLSRS